MLEGQSSSIPDFAKSPANRPVSLLIATTILLLVSAGYLGWQTVTLTNSNNKLTLDNADLKSQVQGLTKQLADAKAASVSARPASSQSVPTPATISAALKEIMAAAITSGNSSALEAYMASSVNVSVAASGKTGAESPAQAVSDLNYLSTGTNPWNFSLSAATIVIFKAGAYGRYFGDTTYVGESANKYVVSFGVNSAGKIDTVFMTNNSDLLN
jgi:hypothetical protein